MWELVKRSMHRERRSMAGAQMGRPRRASLQRMHNEIVEAFLKAGKKVKKDNVGSYSSLDQVGEDERGRGSGVRRGIWRAVSNLGFAIAMAIRLLNPYVLISAAFGQHRSLLAHLSARVDSMRAVLSPRTGRRRRLTSWVQETLPQRNIQEAATAVWEDGSILCGIVETAVPGACPGYDSLSHPNTDRSATLWLGQKLAARYLGVPPAFSDEDLAKPFLTVSLERRLLRYLSAVRSAAARVEAERQKRLKAIGRTTPTLDDEGLSSDCIVQSAIDPEESMLECVARGMGLLLGVKGRRSTFFLYLNPNHPHRHVHRLMQSVSGSSNMDDEAGTILMQLRGPNGDFGAALISTSPGSTSSSRSSSIEVLKENWYGRIPITYTTTEESVKVSYVPQSSGIHELILLLRGGAHVPGSPFSVSVDESMDVPDEGGRITRFGSGRMERWKATSHESGLNKIRHRNSSGNSDPGPRETGERIHWQRKRVVSRVVDFVTEKMILTEDGKLLKLPRKSRRNLDLTSEDENEQNSQRTKRNLRSSKRFLTSDNPIQSTIRHEGEEDVDKMTCHRCKSMDEARCIVILDNTEMEVEKGLSDSERTRNEDATDGHHSRRKKKREKNWRVSDVAECNVPSENSTLNFREHCRRILWLCDILLEHSPRQESLEILNTAGNILDGKRVHPTIPEESESEDALTSGLSTIIGNPVVIAQRLQRTSSDAGGLNEVSKWKESRRDLHTWARPDKGGTSFGGRLLHKGGSYRGIVVRDLNAEAVTGAYAGGDESAEGDEEEEEKMKEYLLEGQAAPRKPHFSMPKRKAGRMKKLMEVRRDSMEKLDPITSSDAETEASAGSSSGKDTSKSTKSNEQINYRDREREANRNITLSDKETTNSIKAIAVKTGGDKHFDILNNESKHKGKSQETIPLGEGGKKEIGDEFQEGTIKDCVQAPEEKDKAAGTVVSETKSKEELQKENEKIRDEHPKTTEKKAVEESKEQSELTELEKIDGRPTRVLSPIPSSCEQSPEIPEGTTVSSVEVGFTDSSESTFQRIELTKDIKVEEILEKYEKEDELEKDASKNVEDNEENKESKCLKTFEIKKRENEKMNVKKQKDEEKVKEEAQYEIVEENDITFQREVKKEIKADIKDESDIKDIKEEVDNIMMIEKEKTEEKTDEEQELQSNNTKAEILENTEVTDKKEKEEKEREEEIEEKVEVSKEIKYVWIKMEDKNAENKGQKECDKKIENHANEGKDIKLNKAENIGNKEEIEKEEINECEEKREDEEEDEKMLAKNDPNSTIESKERVMKEEAELPRVGKGNEERKTAASSYHQMVGRMLCTDSFPQESLEWFDEGEKAEGEPEGMMEKMELTEEERLSGNEQYLWGMEGPALREKASDEVPDVAHNEECAGRATSDQKKDEVVEERSLPYSDAPQQDPSEREKEERENVEKEQSEKEEYVGENGRAGGIGMGVGVVIAGAIFSKEDNSSQTRRKDEGNMWWRRRDRSRAERMMELSRQNSTVRQWDEISTGIDAMEEGSITGVIAKVRGGEKGTTGREREVKVGEGEREVWSTAEETSLVEEAREMMEESLSKDLESRGHSITEILQEGAGEASGRVSKEEGIEEASSAFEHRGVAKGTECLREGGERLGGGEQVRRKSDAEKVREEGEGVERWMSDKAGSSGPKKIEELVAVWETNEGEVVKLGRNTPEQGVEAKEEGDEVEVKEGMSTELSQDEHPCHKGVGEVFPLLPSVSGGTSRDDAPRIEERMNSLLEESLKHEEIEKAEEAKERTEESGECDREEGKKEKGTALKEKEEVELGREIEKAIQDTKREVGGMESLLSTETVVSPESAESENKYSLAAITDSLKIEEKNVDGTKEENEGEMVGLEGQVVVKSTKGVVLGSVAEEKSEACVQGAVEMGVEKVNNLLGLLIDIPKDDVKSKEGMSPKRIGEDIYGVKISLAEWEEEDGKFRESDYLGPETEVVVGEFVASEKEKLGEKSGIIEITEETTKSVEKGNKDRSRQGRSLITEEKLIIEELFMTEPNTSDRMMEHEQILIDTEEEDEQNPKETIKERVEDTKESEDPFSGFEELRTSPEVDSSDFPELEDLISSDFTFKTTTCTTQFNLWPSEEAFEGEKSPMEGLETFLRDSTAVRGLLGCMTSFSLTKIVIGGSPQLMKPISEAEEKIEEEEEVIFIEQDFDDRSDELQIAIPVKEEVLKEFDVESHPRANSDDAFLIFEGPGVTTLIPMPIEEAVFEGEENGDELEEGIERFVPFLEGEDGEEIEGEWEEGVIFLDDEDEVVIPNDGNIWEIMEKTTNEKTPSYAVVMDSSSPLKEKTPVLPTGRWTPRLSLISPAMSAISEEDQEEEEAEEDEESGINKQKDKGREKENVEPEDSQSATAELKREEGEKLDERKSSMNEILIDKIEIEGNQGEICSQKSNSSTQSLGNDTEEVAADCAAAFVVSSELAVTVALGVPITQIIPPVVEQPKVAKLISQVEEKTDPITTAKGDLEENEGSVVLEIKGKNNFETPTLPMTENEALGVIKTNEEKEIEIERNEEEPRLKDKAKKDEGKTTMLDIQRVREMEVIGSKSTGELAMKKGESLRTNEEERNERKGSSVTSQEERKDEKKIFVSVGKGEEERERSALVVKNEAIDRGKSDEHFGDEKTVEGNTIDTKTTDKPRGEKQKSNTTNEHGIFEEDIVIAGSELMEYRFTKEKITGSMNIETEEDGKISHIESGTDGASIQNVFEREIIEKVEKLSDEKKDVARNEDKNRHGWREANEASFGKLEDEMMIGRKIKETKVKREEEEEAGGNFGTKEKEYENPEAEKSGNNNLVEESSTNRPEGAIKKESPPKGKKRCSPPKRKEGVAVDNILDLWSEYDPSVSQKYLREKDNRRGSRRESVFEDYRFDWWDSGFELRKKKPSLDSTGLEYYLDVDQLLNVELEATEPEVKYISAKEIMENFTKEEIESPERVVNSASGEGGSLVAMATAAAFPENFLIDITEEDGVHNASAITAPRPTEEINLWDDDLYEQLTQVSCMTPTISRERNDKVTEGLLLGEDFLNSESELSDSSKPNSLIRKGLNEEQIKKSISEHTSFLSEKKREEKDLMQYQESLKDIFGEKFLWGQVSEKKEDQSMQCKKTATDEEISVSFEENTNGRSDKSGNFYRSIQNKEIEVEVERKECEKTLEKHEGSALKNYKDGIKNYEKLKTLEERESDGNKSVGIKIQEKLDIFERLNEKNTMDGIRYTDSKEILTLPDQRISTKNVDVKISSTTKIKEASYAVQSDDEKEEKGKRKPERRKEEKNSKLYLEMDKERLDINQRIERSVAKIDTDHNTKDRGEKLMTKPLNQSLKHCEYVEASSRSEIDLKFTEKERDETNREEVLAMREMLVEEVTSTLYEKAHNDFSISTDGEVTELKSFKDKRDAREIKESRRVNPTDFSTSIGMIDFGEVFETKNEIGMDPIGEIAFRNEKQVVLKGITENLEGESAYAPDTTEMKKTESTGREEPDRTEILPNDAVVGWDVIKVASEMEISNLDFKKVVENSDSTESAINATAEIEKEESIVANVTVGKPISKIVKSYDKLRRDGNAMGCDGIKPETENIIGNVKSNKLPSQSSSLEEYRNAVNEAYAFLDFQESLEGKIEEESECKEKESENRKEEKDKEVEIKTEADNRMDPVLNKENTSDSPARLAPETSLSISKHVIKPEMTPLTSPFAQIISKEAEFQKILLDDQCKQHMKCISPENLAEEGEEAFLAKMSVASRKEYWDKKLEEVKAKTEEVLVPAPRRPTLKFSGIVERGRMNFEKKTTKDDQSTESSDSGKSLGESPPEEKSRSENRKKLLPRSVEEVELSLKEEASKTRIKSPEQRAKEFSGEEKGKKYFQNISEETEQVSRIPVLKRKELWDQKLQQKENTTIEKRPYKKAEKTRSTGFESAEKMLSKYYVEPEEKISKKIPSIKIKGIVSRSKLEFEKQSLPKSEDEEKRIIETQSVIEIPPQVVSVDSSTTTEDKTETNGLSIKRTSPRSAGSVSRLTKLFSPSTIEPPALIPSAGTKTNDYKSLKLRKEKDEYESKKEPSTPAAGEKTEVPSTYTKGVGEDTSAKGKVLTSKYFDRRKFSLSSAKKPSLHVTGKSDSLPTISRIDGTGEDGSFVARRRKYWEKSDGEKEITSAMRDSKDLAEESMGNGGVQKVRNIWERRASLGTIQLTEEMRRKTGENGKSGYRVPPVVRETSLESVTKETETKMEIKMPEKTPEVKEMTERSNEKEKLSNQEENKYLINKSENATNKEASENDKSPEKLRSPKVLSSEKKFERENETTSEKENLKFEREEKKTSEHAEVAIVENYISKESATTEKKITRRSKAQETKKTLEEKIPQEKSETKDALASPEKENSSEREAVSINKSIQEKKNFASKRREEESKKEMETAPLANQRNSLEIWVTDHQDICVMREVTLVPQFSSKDKSQDESKRESAIDEAATEEIHGNPEEEGEKSDELSLVDEKKRKRSMPPRTISVQVSGIVASGRKRFEGGQAPLEGNANPSGDSGTKASSSLRKRSFAMEKRREILPPLEEKSTAVQEVENNVFPKEGQSKTPSVENIADEGEPTYRATPARVEGEERQRATLLADGKSAGEVTANRGENGDDGRSAISRRAAKGTAPAQKDKPPHSTTSSPDTESDSTEPPSPSFLSTPSIALRRYSADLTLMRSQSSLLSRRRGSSDLGSPRKVEESKKRFTMAKEFFETLGKGSPKTVSIPAVTQSEEEGKQKTSSGKKKKKKRGTATDDETLRASLKRSGARHRSSLRLLGKRDSSESPPDSDRQAAEGDRSQHRRKARRGSFDMIHSAPGSDADSIGEITPSRRKKATEFVLRSRVFGGSERQQRVSERFNVMDLFRDVAGFGSGGGSDLSGRATPLGIPHQAAVLAALRSVEDVRNADTTSPYDIYRPMEAANDCEPTALMTSNDENSNVDNGEEENGEDNYESPVTLRAKQEYQAEYPHLPMTSPRNSRHRSSHTDLIPRNVLLNLENNNSPTMSTSRRSKAELF